MAFGYKKKTTTFKKPGEARKKFTGGGKITLIEYQKTNPDRVNIFVEDEYAFSIAAVLVVERQLKAGVELTPQDSAELQGADLYNQGLVAALQLLAMRPRSESEIQTRLRRRYPDITSETTKKVIERLRELHYLDDASFANFWVENRTAFAPRGRNLLKQELMKKGVPRDVIEAAITAYLDTQAENEDEDEDAGDGLSVEESQALTLARKKAHTYAAEAWPGFYRKLGGFLLRKGYDYGIMGRITKQVWKELKDEEVDDEETE